MKSERIGDLEVHQDLDYQRRAWWTQRVGWAVMTVLLLAALTGVLGAPGPLASARVGTPDGGLVFEYDRFVRAGNVTEMTVFVGREALARGELRLWVDRAYLSGFDIESITPEPTSVEVGADRLTYVIPAQKGAAAGEVTFVVDPQDFGLRSGRLGIDGGPTIAFRQFVYP